jgi:hypothetical protein
MRFWATPTLYVVLVQHWLSLTLAHVAKHDTHGVVGTNVVVGDTQVCVQRHTFIILLICVCCNTPLRSSNTTLAATAPFPDQMGTEGNRQPAWRAALVQGQGTEGEKATRLARSFCPQTAPVPKPDGAEQKKPTRFSAQL